MSNRYHISPDTNRPNICRAQTPDSCPLKSEAGGTVAHFDNKADAKAYAEKTLTEEHGETTSLSKKTASTSVDQGSKDYSRIRVEGHSNFNAATDAPQDFDKVYADVSSRLAEANFQRERANQWIQQKFNKKQYNQATRRTEYIEDPGKILAEVRQRKDLTSSDKQLVERWEEANNEALKNMVLKAKIEQAFKARGGWNRAYLVPDGHLHKSMDCSTCNKGETPTKFQFMTDYSGKDEKNIVAAAGYRACTTCYPSAPIGDERTLPSEMLTDEEKQKKAERTEQKVKLDEKKQKAIENAPTADGSPLKLMLGSSSYPETFKTERSATTWYVNSTINATVHPYRKDEDNIKDKKARYAVLYNLSLKHDKSVAELQKELQSKVLTNSKKQHKEALKQAERMKQMNPQSAEFYTVDEYREPLADKFDVPDEILNKSPRDWSGDENKKFAPQ